MAFVAVASLEQTIERLLDPSESKIRFRTRDAELISRELHHLQSFLETIKSLPSSKILDSPSEVRVKDAAKKLENLIDTHLSDRFDSVSGLSSCAGDGDDDDQSGGRLSLLLLSQHLSKLRQELGSFTTTLTNSSKEAEVEEEKCNRGEQQVEQQKLVGLDKKLKQLENWVLVDGRVVRDRSVIYVVGMAGLGKTALVEQVYNDPRVIQRFQFRLFLKIRPEYESSKEILLLAAHQLGFAGSDDENVSKQELVDYLSPHLFLAKYLIVLDGVWSDRVLEDVDDDFPIGLKSRIIITTQILSIVPSACKNLLQLELLNDDDSWDLLHQIVFTSKGEHCSMQLERVGRKIAKKCEGLPLAIIQVGEILIKTAKAVEEWERLAEKEDPLVITRDDNTTLSEALYLSYRMLPQDLKACFLYMGVFPKNYEITRSGVIRLLVSEGFVKRGQFMTGMDQTAEQYLDELVSRSVVLSNKQRSVDESSTKSCRLHFTFRNLCVAEAKSESLFPVIRKYNDNLPGDIDSQQRLAIHNNILLGFKQVHEWMELLAPDVRSLLCFGPNQQYPIELYLRFRLLKVLDALAVHFYEFPDQVLRLFHLRYLAITYDGDELPTAISCLWNLEVLIVHRHHIIIKSSSLQPVYLPVEIWNMHKLKHIHCMGFDLPYPLTNVFLRGLLTLSGVTAHSCNRGILRRMPNLKKVGIRMDSSHHSTENFSFLSHFTSICTGLKSLKCIVINPRDRMAKAIPSSPETNAFTVIRKMTLSGCGLPWKCIEAIGALMQFVEVLKLRCHAFWGPVWRSVQFPRLEYLLLEDLDLKRWKADNRHLEKLRHVIVRHCYKLKHFPRAFESIESLQMIELEDCSKSAVLAIEGINERRKRLTHNKLPVQTHSSWDKW